MAAKGVGGYEGGVIGVEEAAEQWELKKQQSKLKGLEIELIININITRANLPPKEKAKLEEQAPSMIGQKGLTDMETSFGTKIEGLDAKVHEVTKKYTALAERIRIVQ